MLWTEWIQQHANWDGFMQTPSEACSKPIVTWYTINYLCVSRESLMFIIMDFLLAC